MNRLPAERACFDHGNEERQYMNGIDIIKKKRDGKRLSKEEIDFFICEMTRGTIADYQIAAFLMAVYLNDIDEEETFLLTDAMKRSGEIIDLSGIEGIKVDKHSTGGVGDKTTLIAGPIAAACGVPVPKMSGRGLGMTGGTVDKLESIPGFKVSLTMEEFEDRVNETGIAITGQTAQVAKADKILYALRDVTGTVENTGLIASSIMSKKLASGSDAIVLDVKCGCGAFMKSEEEAGRLAEAMVKIGKCAGKRMIALITDMEQPLGRAVGNSLEVAEAIETLKGHGPGDITELSVTLAGAMIAAGGKAETHQEGVYKAEKAVENGKALEKMRELIEGQKGDPAVIYDSGVFPKAGVEENIRFTEDMAAGKADCDTYYVNRLHAGLIGEAVSMTGAGRQKKEDDVDLAAGIYLHKKEGETVKLGEILATVYAHDEEKLMKGKKLYMEAVKIGGRPVKRPLIIGKAGDL